MDRAALLASRRRRFHAAFARHPDVPVGTVLVVPSGLPVPIPGTDAHHPFRASDAHRWLAGAAEPGCVLVFDGSGTARLFVPRPDREDVVWHGEPPALEDVAGATGLADVRPASELDGVLALARSAAFLGAPDLFERPAAYGVHPTLLERVAFDEAASAAAEEAMVAGRLVKDDGEVALLERAIAATVAGHARLRELARAGRRERDVAADLEHAFRLAGGDGTAYPSIVLAGPRAAVLHGTPSDAVLAPTDLLLVDAAAEVEGYDADVTRTVAVDPARLPGEARAIHDLVRAAQEATVAAVRAGVETVDLHLGACRRLAEGLVDLGLLVGDPDGLVEDDVHAVFLPHGIGHPLGLATHDVGGYLADRPRATRPTLRRLRMDRPLVEGMVVTIEPGLYFIPALLDDPDLRRRHAGRIDFDRVERYRAVGGVRIEDDVLVGADGGRVLGPPLARGVEGAWPLPRA